MSIIENTLALILVLSVLVVVHEFGHYAVAKAFGFPVEVFSIGFGKRLFGRNWRGTDYRVSAIPLGGYVKVIGLGPDESTLADGTSTEAPPVGKRWQRALILLAGPFMNLVLALVLHATVFSVGVRVPAYELQPPVVKQVEPGSPGATAGIQPGDRIVSIDSTETPRWRDAQFLFAMNARQKLDVEFDRNGQHMHAQVVPRAATKYDIGEVGLFPGAPREPRIVMIVSNDPADKAGLKKGDIVVSIAGKQIKGAPEDILTKFVAGISAAAPGPFPITYLRKGKLSTAMISPKHDPDGSWKVGVQVAADLEEVVERFPPGQAAVEAWRKVQSDFRMTLAILGRLFVGRASIRTMSGPLDIAKFSGEAARTGAVPLAALMAAISLQLGIFNLLPIPVLDGGHLFLLTVESAARRDFSLAVKERILQVGFLMILALISVILYNDLAKNLPAKWWPF
ncbi:MAG TPA: RIP metalloprotease RseP [Thermoanaerobaculia bacterium]|nr:RIP metalloprotease RseP [Thermoanaerobaculia bacterium]